MQIYVFQAGFHGSKVQWNTTIHDNRMRHQRHYFCSTSLLNWIYWTILPIYFKSPIASVLHTTMLSFQSMSMKWSPLKTVNMAWPDGLFSSQQCTDDNLGSSDNSSPNAHSKCSAFGKFTNQFLSPHLYGYPRSLWPISGFFPVPPTLSIQHDSSFPTKYPCKWRIKKGLAIVASIRNPPSLVLWTLNVSAFTAYRMTTNFSRCTSSSSRTTSQQSSYAADIL